MKKLYLILLFSMFFAFSLAAQPLSYDSFTKKYKEAAQLYYQKRYESALQILDILAADDYAQTYPSVFLSRSLVLYYMGRYDEAKIDIEKAIAFQPYTLKLRLCRSMINMALKEYEEALADINYCLEKNPTWADAYHQKGLIYLTLSNYSEALDNFDNALATANGSYKPEYFSDRGFAYYYLHYFEKAKDDFLHSLTLTENDNVYLCLIDVCYKLQQYDEGIKYANILIKPGRRVESAIIDRAYIYLVQKRYDEVRADLDLIEKSCENLSSYHKVKAVYSILTGDKASAIEAVNKAYILNSQDKDILILREALSTDEIDICKIVNLLIDFSYTF